MTSADIEKLKELAQWTETAGHIPDTVEKKLGAGVLSLIAALEAAQGSEEKKADMIAELDQIVKAKDAEIERLRKALKPFATAANFYEIESQTFEETQILVKKGEGFSSALQVKDFRQARALLSKQDSGKAQP
jgi:hypothetical protein